VICSRADCRSSTRLTSAIIRSVPFYVRDAEGQVVGGVVGEFAFGWLSIHVLWIAENLRGAGMGTRILQAAENAAVENGCHAALLDTMSFQAPAFYEKRGYVRVGVVDSFPGGAQKIFMRKNLA
jgi:GNAT superfamily N-acetyltransferase